MKLLKTIEDLKQIDRSGTLCLIPTMGALHDGHLSLVELAKENADKVCVSIFVNPLQFGEGEDLDKYPRILESDLEKLAKLEVDYVFAPETEEIYPNKTGLPHDKVARNDVIKANKKLTDCLCGMTRPGHFDGVCIVVKRLFDLIRPDSAVFGEKDYQQLMVIEDMVSKLKLKVKIIKGEIVREMNGLAMSSRNHYLTEEELMNSGNIFKTLSGIRGEFFTLEEGRDLLENLGIKVEYLEKKWGRLFFAGKIGTTRLIDNVRADKFY